MAEERLGEVAVPSGTLTLSDAGHIGMFLAEEIPAVPSNHIEGLPRDRVLPIVGRRVGKGRWARCWEWVAIVVGDGTVASSEPHGDVMVDFARILVADEQNADDWVHDDTIDGLADFVFWGRDAATLAKEIGAPTLPDGFGWKDLAIDEVVERGTKAEELKDARGWKLATDFRPHSHHFQLLELVRASDTESGTIDVAGRKVCLFMTSWGDGLFPVYLDHDAAGALVRVRIQLHTAVSEAAMAEVNG